MKTQFEWHIGSDDGRWETIASAVEQPRGKWIRQAPWWVWFVLVSIVVGAVTAGCLILRQRYRQARLQMEFQIQSVIDLEAAAYAEGDLALFAAQQDETAPDWYEYQTDRFQTPCSKPGCIPILPAKIQLVAPQGDIASVEVIEGQSPVRRLRFYRQTDRGWKHTAPPTSFWETVVELTYGRVVFLYHQRDEPHIDSLTQHIYDAFDAVCAELRCAPYISLFVDFSVAPQTNSPAYLPQEGKLVLLSPWLSGIPVGGTWEASYLRDLTYWTAYATFLQPLRHAMTPEPTLFQRALADEYATYRSHRDWVQTAILKRVVSVQRDRALPRIFTSLPESRSLSPFLARWLSLSPDDQPQTYFEALLNIEREALLVGRKDTFFLLQDDDQEWQAHQARAFDQAQLAPQPPPTAPIRVQEVDIVQNRARVTLDGPPTTDDGQNLSSDHFVFFRWRDSEWKHASPSYLAYWDAASSAAPVTPTSTPQSGQEP